MKKFTLLSTLLAGACLVSLAACGDKANQAKSADWYLAHSKDLQAKLASCKADPDSAKSDPDCAAATDAFLRWYAASGMAARQADAEGNSLDSRLSAPAPATAPDGMPATDGQNADAPDADAQSTDATQDDKAPPSNQ